MITTETDTPPMAASPPESFVDQLAEMTEAVSAASAQLFEKLLPRVVERMLGQGEQADAALASGGFVLNDCTVVMRLNPQTDTVEFFCDVGMPAPHAREAVYRTALEMNLCRTHAGVTFGIHPESGRLVATTSAHALLLADDQVCIDALHLLTEVCSQLRAERVVDVEL